MIDEDHFVQNLCTFKIRLFFVYLVFEKFSTFTKLFIFFLIISSSPLPNLANVFSVAAKIK